MGGSGSSEWEIWESDTQVVIWKKSRAKVGSSGSLVSRFSLRAISAASPSSLHPLPRTASWLCLHLEVVRRLLSQLPGRVRGESEEGGLRRIPGIPVGVGVGTGVGGIDTLLAPLFSDPLL